jgi:hypothetical protein
MAALAVWAGSSDESLTAAQIESLRAWSLKTYLVFSSSHCLWWSCGLHPLSPGSDSLEDPSHHREIAELEQDQGEDRWSGPLIAGTEAGEGVAGSFSPTRWRF